MDWLEGILDEIAEDMWWDDIGDTADEEIPGLGPSDFGRWPEPPDIPPPVEPPGPGVIIDEQFILMVTYRRATSRVTA